MATLCARAARGGLIEFYHSNNLTFASSIAYYSLLSLFPFLLIVASLLSRFAVSRETLLPVMERALPQHLEFLVARIEDIARAPLELGLFGGFLALWASMGVFGAVTSAVNHAWNVETPMGFLKHQLVAFLMMLAAGVLLFATLLLVSFIQVVDASWFQGVVARYPSLQSFTGFVSRNAPIPLFTLAVGLIYYFVPNTKVRLRDVWPGAILAGLLWRGAFGAFAWYLGDVGRLQSVHGSVTAVVVFLLWVYLSAIILLYGVEVTAVFARLQKKEGL